MRKTPIADRPLLSLPDDQPGLPKVLRAPHVDLEAGALLQVLDIPARMPVNLQDLRPQRKVFDMMARFTGRNMAVSRVREFYILTEDGMVETRIYYPTHSKELQPAFVWFHGGAFVIGGLGSADTICRHIAAVSGVVVVSVRYRLSPENTLYAGRADCLWAVQWLAENGAEVGIDGTRLAVGGDSAGGNLAAVVAQRCVQEEGIPIRLQVLAYPGTNMLDEYPSKYENAEGYVLTAEVINSVIRMMKMQHTDPADPWISPALNPKLDDLPPAVILTIGYDPLRDDGLAYAQLLRRAGVPVDLLHYAGQFHGFLNFDGMMRVARDGLRRMALSLKAALAPDSPQPYPNRTTEISAGVRIPLPAGAASALAETTTTAPRLGAKMFSSVLMMGELMESMRSEFVRESVRRMPWFSGVAGWWGRDPDKVPALNPFTTYRAWVEKQSAPLVVKETFNADKAPEKARQRAATTAG